MALLVVDSGTAGGRQVVQTRCPAHHWFSAVGSPTHGMETQTSGKPSAPWRHLPGYIGFSIQDGEPTGTYLLAGFKW